jgi:hypothetical protein
MQIEALEVTVMEQAIEAYRSITAAEEFQKLNRLRSVARHNEEAAKDEARRDEREKWQLVIVEKDARIAEKDARIAELEEQLAKMRGKRNE